MATTKISIDERGIATLSLARPEKHNAMSGEMIAELHTAGDQLAADDNVRVVQKARPSARGAIWNGCGRR